MREATGTQVEVSKKAQVYNILKERIIQNELTPQEYLNEQDICEELGVRKTPVREVFEIREILECAAARLAAGVPSKSQFVSMPENHESFKVVNDDSVRQSLLSGYQIHEVIVNSAGNSFLSEYYGSVLDHILRIRINALSRFNSSRLHAICDEHKAILRFIIDGDADGAEKAMRDHLKASLLSIDQLLLGNRKAS